MAKANAPRTTPRSNQSQSIQQEECYSEAEMAARMYEAVNGYTRPQGMSAKDYIDRIPDREQREDFLGAARAAMLYTVEVFSEPLSAPTLHLG